MKKQYKLFATVGDPLVSVFAKSGSLSELPATLDASEIKMKLAPIAGKRKKTVRSGTDVQPAKNVMSTVAQVEAMRLVMIEPIEEERAYHLRERMNNEFERESSPVSALANNTSSAVHVALNALTSRYQGQAYRQMIMKGKLEICKISPPSTGKFKMPENIMNMQNQLIRLVVQMQGSIRDKTVMKNTLSKINANIQRGITSHDYTHSRGHEGINRSN